MKNKFQNSAVDFFKSDFCCKIRTTFGLVDLKKYKFGPKSENSDLIGGTGRVKGRAPEEEGGGLNDGVGHGTG